MKSYAFAALALGVLLAGCANDYIVPQCPSAAVLSDTGTLTVFRAGAPADPSGEAYTVSITKLESSCNYPAAAPAATARLNFTLRAVRAPSADGAEYDVPYYLAITQGERILSKRNMTLHMVFAPGSAATSQEVDLSDLQVVLEEGHPPTDYQLLVGFQMSDADRAYNQTRGRYTP